MRNFYLVSSLFFTFSSAVVSVTAIVSATFSNAVQYQFDTDGSAIDSTSGKIDFLGGSYVWYGVSFGCGSAFCGIASYSSPDLKTWKYNGYLFDPNTPEIDTLCGAPLSGNCGRPHIVYSAATNDYVLWVNSGSPGYALFTSSSPTGGYTLDPNRALIGYQPPGTQGGDFSVEVINGTGYLVYSLIDFTTTGASIWPPFLQSMYAQQLTPDFRNTTGSAYHVVSSDLDLVDYEAESPDIFYRNGYFYVSASNTCGFCAGTLLIIYRSRSIEGPWTRQIISGDTCGGQSTQVLTLPSPQPGAPASYLHQADLFGNAPLTGTRTAAHGHQFQLLVFDLGGSVQNLDCSPSKSVTIPIIPGTNESTTGLAVSATDGSGETGAYSVSCELPTYQLYQTWASLKSGKLVEIGVNIAGDAPTGNLSITVFRYSNNSNFFTPRYVWDTLTTTSIPPASISQALEVMRVPVNAQVAQGDRLGIALVSASITPICVMVRNASSVLWDVNSSTRTLFANGVNQVSLRGSNGKTPPVFVMPGQEIKWYAIVN
jgi:hypothetical protein